MKLSAARALAVAMLAPLACASLLGVESVGYAPEAGDGGQANDGSGDAGADSPVDGEPATQCDDVDASAFLDTPDALVIPTQLVCDDGGGGVNPQSDPANCGRCGHACPGIGSNRCTGGACTPETLATVPSGPVVFAVQGARAYWLHAGGTDGSLVQSAPVAGGAVATLVGPASGLALRAAALHGDTVYVGGDGIRAVPIDGGTIKPFTHLSGEVVTHLTATATALFWLNASSSRAGFVEMNDTSSQVLFDAVVGGVNDLQSDDAQAYWLQTADLIVADDTTRSPRIFRQSFTPDTVTLDARYVYLFDRATRTIVRRSRANLAAAPVVLGRLPGQAEAVLRLAVDELNVYAIAGAAGSNTQLTLFAMPKCGGAPVVLVDRADLSDGLVATGGFVYFGTLSGRIARVAR